MKNTNDFSIKKYFKNSKFKIFLYLFIEVIAIAIIVFSTIMLAEAIELMVAENYKQALILVGVVGVLHIIKWCLYFISTNIYYNTTENIFTKINTDLCRQALRLESTSYKKFNTGTFIDRINYSPHIVIGGIADIIDEASNLLQTVIVLLYIMVLNIYVGSLIFFTLLVVYFIEKLRVKTLLKNTKTKLECGDKSSSLVAEIINNEKDVKSLSLENSLEELCNKNYSNFNRANKNMRKTNTQFINFKTMIVNVLTVAIIILSIFLVEKSLLTFALFMVIYSNNHNISSSITSAGTIVSLASEVKVYNNRMNDFYNPQKFICEKFGSIDISNMQGSIEFKNAEFSFKDNPIIYDDSYKKNKSKNTKSVITKLNLKIKPRTTVAIVAESGSGKTTMLNLINKIYKLDKGEILIDGVNINKLDKKNLREDISLVNQSAFLFDMSIRDNLTLSKQDITEDEIYNALKKVYLYDYVMQLPNKIDSIVGEKGADMSGGQRQRLAICRALIKNSKILMLDECTSSLDNISQSMVMKTLNKLKGQITIIIVAHRMSTIKNGDNIYFLNNGKIEDNGNFDDLYNKNENFKNLFLAENLNKKLIN